MDISFIFQIEKEPLEVGPAYERLVGFLDKVLGPLLPGIKWHLYPSTPRESREPWPAVDNREPFLARSRKRYAEKVRKWPDNPYGAGFLLSNAADEKNFAVQEGNSTLSYDPGFGRIELDIKRPDVAWPDSDLTQLMKSILTAVVDAEPVKFASLDTEYWYNRDGESGWDSFRWNFHTFPHREFLGWMGFVPRVLAAKDIPEAAEVIPVPERNGSIVIVMNEVFDLFNPEHIKRIQQVEMRLVDFDALPVTDPAYR